MIQITLADWLGPSGALLLASALFGLAHFLTPTYAALAALLGLYLGGLLIVSDNLTRKGTDTKGDILLFW